MLNLKRGYPLHPVSVIQDTTLVFGEYLSAYQLGLLVRAKLLRVARSSRIDERVDERTQEHKEHEEQDNTNPIN